MSSLEFFRTTCSSILEFLNYRKTIRLKRRWPKSSDKYPNSVGFYKNKHSTAFRYTGHKSQTIFKIQSFHIKPYDQISNVCGHDENRFGGKPTRLTPAVLFI